MVRHVLMGAVLFASVVSAQPRPNRIEKAKDRQDLRQDRRQLADDRLDAVRAAQLLRDYDAAAIANDAARLAGLEQAINAHLARELAESKVESAQARQEVREDKRELAGDRRELRQDVALGRRPGGFDPPSVSQKRQLIAEVVGQAVGELQRDKSERREDRRELREDRRETREDRRDPVR